MKVEETSDFSQIHRANNESETSLLLTSEIMSAIYNSLKIKYRVLILDGFLPSNECRLIFLSTALACLQATPAAIAHRPLKNRRNVSPRMRLA